MTAVSRSNHILVVDDNGDVRDVLIAMLEGCGYRVSSATDGKSMRDFLAGGDAVDAVVLDALLPDEASSVLALHAQDLRVPVVMISGSPAAIQFAIENGLQLLEKPFRMQELLDGLDAAIKSGEFGHRTAC
jgi:two-component system OmpR family response regulator